MPRTQFRLQVELDSGETYIVVADQRDLAAVEARDDVADTSFTRIRYMAWNAARRAKRYTGTWEKWNSTDCAEVDPADDEVEGTAAEDGEPGLDPGKKDQSAAS